MEEGVSHWRPEVDDLIAVSSQLQALSSQDQAEELFQSTAEMNRRVNQIADKVGYELLSRHFLFSLMNLLKG